MTDIKRLLKCSFCGKNQKQVKKMVAGPLVYICNECVDLCCQILEEEGVFPQGRYLTGFDPEAFLSNWVAILDPQDMKRVREVRELLERLLVQLNKKDPSHT